MSDPSKRPPDPAGTQPKVDPESLRVPLAPGHQIAAAADLHPAAQATAVEAVAGDTATLPAPPTTGAEHAPDRHGADTPAPLDTRAAGSQRAREHPHTPRFQFLFGALGALSVAAVALVVLLLRAPAPAPETPWSAWKPADNGIDPAQQIAEHVAPQYRLDNGEQIVRVTGGPPAVKGQPLTVGVVKSGQTPAALEGNSVLYQLCGSGSDCSIKQGKPSVERGLLLSREALALALYTFRYVSGVSQVIVTIPPPPSSATKTTQPEPGTGSPAGSKAPTETTSATTSSGSASASTGSTSGSSGLSTASGVVHHALLFSQQNVTSALSRPLSATLSTTTPRVSQMNSWPDAATVKALTDPRLYDFVISESQQTGAVMLLEPPGLGG